MKRNAAGAVVGTAADIETPTELGYRMPAEWEPHQATWIAWPHERRDWPGKLVLIPSVYGQVVRHLVEGERVGILVDDARTTERARRLLTRLGVDLGRVDFRIVPTDRSWTRDTCPLFVKRDRDGDVALTDWKFNGWAKYPNHLRDDAVPRRLGRRLGLRRFVPKIPFQAGGQGRQQVVLEGGSIDVDGAGTLLTTEECLLSPIQARNPRLSRADLERVLGAYLGVRKVVWLGRGIAGDDTHGHVDDLARFVAPRTVVLAAEPNAKDVNQLALAENRERLSDATDAAGARIQVVELPMPEPVVFDGVRLPASYANFYVGNAAVLVPTFNDAADGRALGILADLFPERKVVGIHSLDLIWGLGALHCMTQQQPAGGKRSSGGGTAV